MSLNVERKGRYTDAELQEILATLPGHDPEAQILYDAPEDIGLITPLIKRDFILAAIMPHPDPGAFERAVSQCDYKTFAALAKKLTNASCLDGKIYESSHWLMQEPELKDIAIPDVVKEAILRAVRFVNPDDGEIKINKFWKEFDQPYPTNTSHLHREIPYPGKQHTTMTAHHSIKGGLQYLTGAVDPETFMLLGGEDNYFEEYLEDKPEWAQRLRITNPGDLLFFGTRFFHRSVPLAEPGDHSFNISAEIKETFKCLEQFDI